MCKRVETFNANKDYKLAIVVLNQLCCFQNRNFWNTSQTLFFTFYMKMNYFNIFFHMTSDKWERF